MVRNPRNEGHHVKSKNQTYPYHHSPPPTAFIPPEYYYIVNATEPPSLEQIAAERERIRIEFFSTYDAMTGVRIATTLGGFFGLMVFLVIYKSRGERIETMKALKVYVVCFFFNKFLDTQYELFIILYTRIPK